MSAEIQGHSSLAWHGLVPTIACVFCLWPYSHESSCNSRVPHSSESDVPAPLHLQVFNEINARRIEDELNVFEGFFVNPLFIGVVVFTSGLQALIMQTPINYIFKVVPLNGKEWACTLAIGAGSIPMSFLVRICTRYVLVLVQPPKSNNGFQSLSFVVEQAQPVQEAARLCGRNCHQRLVIWC
jgi:hypothetical protein